jgi:hypothetical protein
VVSMISTSMRSAEEISFLTPNPPHPGEERDSAERTMGVGPMVIIATALRARCRAEKFSLQVLYPPRRERNGTPAKGRWGSTFG